ncbi:hypothetical protein N5J77_26265, partial [Sphingobium yanoikuyae]
LDRELCPTLEEVKLATARNIGNIDRNYRKAFVRSCPVFLYSFPFWGCVFAIPGVIAGRGRRPRNARSAIVHGIPVAFWIKRAVNRSGVDYAVTPNHACLLKAWQGRLYRTV